MTLPTGLIGVIRCILSELVELLRLIKFLFFRGSHKNSGKKDGDSLGDNKFSFQSIFLRILLWVGVIVLIVWIVRQFRQWSKKNPVDILSSSSSPISSRGILDHFLYLFLTRHPSSVGYTPPPASPPPPPPSSSSSSLSSIPPIPKEEKLSKGERACKEYVEEYFGKSFTRCRPDFMQNPVTKENLELDLYNEELKLAIEYNGRQHYEYVPFMHTTKESFYSQQYRDLIKQDLCKKNGIELIIVPYKIPDSEIPRFMENEITKIGKNIKNIELPI